MLSMFCCVHVKFKFKFKLYFIVVKFIFLVYSLLCSSLFELIFVISVFLVIRYLTVFA